MSAKKKGPGGVALVGMKNVLQPLPKESAKAFAAFKAYAELGPQRSLRAAGKKLGKSEPLMRW